MSLTDWAIGLGLAGCAALGIWFAQNGGISANLWDWIKQGLGTNQALSNAGSSAVQYSWSYQKAVDEGNWWDMIVAWFGGINFGLFGTN